MSPIIRVTDLTVRFGHQLALDDVSFEVDAGECLALWGANGAGKTTALRAILGLVPASGQVLVAGHDLAADDRAVRRAVGYVPQQIALYADLSTLAQLRFLGRLRGTADDEPERLLHEVGLWDQSSKPVGALSGGMRQRLALAVALLGDPPVLLLDEPSASLDRAGRGAFQMRLSGLRSAGKTLLITTHREEEVAALADRVLELKAGRVAGAAPSAAWLAEQGRGAQLSMAVGAGES